jgi:hypothetical protein
LLSVGSRGAELVTGADGSVGAALLGATPRPESRLSIAVASRPEAGAALELALAVMVPAEARIWLIWAWRAAASAARRDVPTATDTGTV